MTDPPVLREFGERLTALGWVTDLWVAGSLATGDFVPGVSDLDLVAVVHGPIDGPRRLVLTDLHQQVDTGAGAGQDLECVYVPQDDLPDAATLHPTWTHGYLTDRILSGITRAELVRHGYPVLGRPPREVLPAMSDDDVRAAARAELAGYWPGRSAVRGCGSTPSSPTSVSRRWPGVVPRWSTAASWTSPERWRRRTHRRGSSGSSGRGAGGWTCARRV